MFLRRLDVADITPLNGHRTFNLPPASETGDNYEPRTANNSWRKNLYTHAWFDSKPEYFAARAIDGAPGAEGWARLHRNDAPIQWNYAGRE